MARQYLQAHLERLSAVPATLLRHHTAIYIRARRCRQGVRFPHFVVNIFQGGPKNVSTSYIEQSVNRIETFQ